MTNRTVACWRFRLSSCRTKGYLRFGSAGYVADCSNADEDLLVATADAKLNVVCLCLCVSRLLIVFF